jgi:hypothetical protein
MRCRWCLAVALLVLLAMPAPAGAQQSTVEYFGYFAARITPAGGDHLAEVADRSNLNWVQISDVDRYRPEVLDGCRPRGCIVSTGHEFFTGCDGQGSPSCNLYPDYRERWQRLADAVRSRIDKVGAFYLLDEPQFRGASPEELATAAAAIKATYPSVPVMMVEADIEAKLAILERRTSAAQRLFLMPEAAPLKECGGAPGHATDAEIAALQMRYLQLAEAHPRVIGLLAFGFWTSGYDSADLPRTVAAHRAIAARVIRPPAPPAPPPPAPAPQVVKRAAVVKRGIRIDRRGRVTVPLRCSRAATVACTGRLALAARGRVLARKRFSVAPGTSTRLRVRTRRPAIVRRARRRAGVPARLMLRTPAGGATLKVRLRRR